MANPAPLAQAGTMAMGMLGKGVSQAVIVLLFNYSGQAH